MAIRVEGIDTPVAVLLAPTGAGGLVSFTRAANQTQYTANDVVGGTGPMNGVLDLGVLGPGGTDVLIQSTRLMPRLTAVPGTAAMGNMRLALYSKVPPSILADNAAWTVPLGDIDAFIDTIDLGTPALPAASAQTILISRDNIGKQVTLPPSGRLWAYLVTDVGYTPAANSEVYSLVVKAVAL